MEKQKISNKLFILLIVAVACITFLQFQPKTLNTGREQLDGEEETRLEAVLQEIEGVGHVEVYFHQPTGKNSSDSLLFSDYFQKQVPVSESGGVLIVAEGAENVFIRTELAEIISKILQLPQHRIVIVPMKKREEVIQ